MSTLLANTEDAYSFPPFSIMERAITLRKKDLHKGKKQDIVKLRMRERAILDGFLGAMPVTRLVSPDFGWADVIPQRVGLVATDVTGGTSMSTEAAGSARTPRPLGPQASSHDGVADDHRADAQRGGQREAAAGAPVEQPVRADRRDFVDDSDDRTPQWSSCSRTRAIPPLDVRLLHRRARALPAASAGRSSLGLERTDTTWVCVMDGDLQHPPERVPALLTGRSGPQGATSSSPAATSPAVATKASARSARSSPGGRRYSPRRVFPHRLRGIRDPMSGFFLFRRRR